MGRPGNPALAAKQNQPHTRQAMTALKSTIETVRQLEQASIQGETLLLSKTAALALMTAYAQQTGQPDPGDAIQS